MWGGLFGMNSRERVLLTLNHKEPDKVPLFEHSINPHIVQALAEATNESESQFINLKQFGVIKTSLILDLDLLCVTLEELNEYDYKINGDRWIDEFGRVWQKDYTPGAGMGNYCGGLIQEESDIKKYTPLLHHEKRLPNSIKKIIEKYSDHAFVYRWYGPLELTYESMGIEKFSLSLYDNRNLVKKLIENRTDWVIEISQHAINLGVDFIFLGDDAGFKTAPLFSPKDYKEIVAPCYKRICDNLKVPVFVHSCGYVEDLIPIMIESGIQGIHPLEPMANMNLKKIKNLFGNSLTLFGNVDCSWILCQENKQFIRDEVDRCLRDGAIGGGYILSSSNSLHAGIPPENALELFSYASKIGYYSYLHKKYWDNS